jgi:hypothetical protein
MAADRPRRSAYLATAALLLLFGSLCITPAVHVTPSQLPARIGDRAFWRMVVDFSEAGGFFRSDNLISNEKTFQQVIPQLQRTVAPAGVYIGVGPDQNFTYIAALRPRIAFIVDIRRQNMLLHLMYKALIEQSSDRADFLSRLFSRLRPTGVGSTSTVEALLEAFGAASPSEALFELNLRSIDDHLVSRHNFSLSASDLHSIEYVYRAFFTGGPDLRYSFGRPGFGGWRPFPTYGDLMMETDGRGQHHGYLASEENFRTLRALEVNNLIVPVVGNFAGGKALRAIGDYLREHRATVSAFYTSNVEQYLFQGDEWRRFCSNVAELPVDGTSTFIRAFFNNAGYRPQLVGPGLQSQTLLDSMAGFVAAFSEGQLRSYGEVIERSH